MINILTITDSAASFLRNWGFLENWKSTASGESRI